MVTRRRDPDGERRVIVELTPQAEAIREEVWAISDKIKSDCRMDEGSMMALRDTLQNFAHPAA